MNTKLAQLFIRCYAALWFLVGAYYAVMLLRSVTSEIGGFALGFAILPLIMCTVAVWLWFARDIWGKRIITTVLGLYATVFVLGKPWLALISLVLMALALWATRFIPKVSTPPAGQQK